MAMAILFLCVGFVLLYFGGDYLVRGSSSLALQLGLTPLVVGLTVVAFGTSSPELAVSLKAAFDGVGDVALGNVVGSNICNLALILAVAVVIKPQTVNLRILRVEVPLMIGVSTLVPWVLWDAEVSRIEGLLLVVGLIFFIGLNVHAGRREKAAVQEEYAAAIHDGKPLWLVLVWIAGGLGALVAGGHFFVEGAIIVARSMGVSEAVIGLTVVAFGTSLPELATSIIAASRGEGDIVFGNVVGSNIFNILCILGLTALIQPLQASGITTVDTMMMVGVAVCTLPLMYWGRRLGRVEGCLLLGSYGLYLLYLIR